MDAVGEGAVVGCVERDFVGHVGLDGVRGLVGRQGIGWQRMDVGVLMREYMSDD